MAVKTIPFSRLRKKKLESYLAERNSGQSALNFVLEKNLIQLTEHERDFLRLSYGFNYDKVANFIDEPEVLNHFQRTYPSGVPIKCIAMLYKVSIRYTYRTRKIARQKIKEFATADLRIFVRK